MSFTFAIELFAAIMPMMFLLLPFVYLLVKNRRWSQSLSKSNATAPRIVRVVELTILALFSLSLMFFICTGGYGLATTPLPSFIWRDRAIICGVIAVGTMAWMVLGARRSVAAAAAGFLASTVLGTGVLAASKMLAYERYEDEIRKIALPIEISIRDEISDVDVLINGVRMGKAPLHTTIEEIDQKAPAEGKVFDEDPRNWRNFNGGTYLPGKKLTLDRALDVKIGNSHRQPIDVYVQFERHGKPVWIFGGIGWSGGSRMFGNIQPARIPLSIMTEEWEQDVKTLLMKARLADYHVDGEWVSAADSYFHLVRNGILAAMDREPRFQHVLNDWARLRYGFSETADPRDAWQVLKQIQEQADRQQSYSTDSIAGDAVELLVSRLDAKQVIAAADARLKSILAGDDFGYGWGWSSRNGRTDFSTTPDGHSHAIKAGDFVLAHVVWRLDQYESLTNPGQDNDVERIIVPDLLRISYWVPQVKPIAEELGGSALDQFQLRQQAGVYSYQPSSDYLQNEYIAGDHILRSFIQAVNSRTPSGAKFRKENSQQALDLAELMLKKSFSLTSVPDWTQFLFLDVDGGEPLALAFWDKFRTRVESDAGTRSWSLGVLWTYLSRIKPIPSAADFIAAFPDEVKSFGDYGNPEEGLNRIPEDVRLQVVLGCLEKAAQAKSKNAPDSVPWQAANQVAFQLVRYLPTIPTEAAVDVVMSRLQPDHPQASTLRDRIKDLARFGALPDPLLKRLASSNVAEHRLSVVDQIRMVPDSANLAMLVALKSDPDQAVREASTQVANQLETLRQLPLPHLN